MVRSTMRRLYTGLLFTFLYAPILVLIVFSFNSSKSTAHWDGFSFKWYMELFSDQQIITALYNTVAIALSASIIATIIGTFAAFGIHHFKKTPKRVILAVSNLPIMNPDIVTGVSLMTLFVFFNYALGFSSLLLAHITFNIPYIMLSVLPKLKQMPQDTLDAAMDLGATPWYAFRKVILPEILPGIVTGFLIAFTMSIDDFVISFFTTGNGVSNLSITIYAMARRGIKPIINALSTLMFIFVLTLMLVINSRTSKDEQTMFRGE